MISTRERVPQHTQEDINRRIQEEIAARVEFYDRHPDRIRSRLLELDEEWDIERAIEANAASISLIGTVLGGVTRDRRWLVLPALVAGFLLQHAIEGWCPPVPVLRRLGFRTSYEIEQERQALKALRGDFDAISRSDDRARAAIEASAA